MVQGGGWPFEHRLYLLQLDQVDVHRLIVALLFLRQDARLARNGLVTLVVLRICHCFQTVWVQFQLLDFGRKTDRGGLVDVLWLLFGVEVHTTPGLLDESFLGFLAPLLIGSPLQWLHVPWYIFPS